MARKTNKKLATKAPALPTSKNLHLCGVCGKNVPGDRSNHYITQCVVCRKQCSIHEKKSCINPLWNQCVLAKANNIPSQLPTTQQFNSQKSLDLYCNECKEACFYCIGKYHNSGMHLIKSFEYKSYYTISHGVFMYNNLLR